MTSLRPPRRESLIARRPLVIGNWKMHGDVAMLSSIAAVAPTAQTPRGPIVGLAVSHTLISAAATIAHGFLIGAQDVHEASSGAHTGDVSAKMAHASGAGFTIVGHSERRACYGETDAVIGRKVMRASEAGLDVLLCCGEPSDVRAQGRTHAHVQDQLAGNLATIVDPAFLAIAYEPLWAISTGCVPSRNEIVSVIDAIRSVVRERFGRRGSAIPILYGGSVQPHLAPDLAAIASLDGVLVGAASLDPVAFRAVIQAFTYHPACTKPASEFLLRSNEIKGV